MNRDGGSDHDDKRGLVESSARCLCIPCLVTLGVTRACCCPGCTTSCCFEPPPPQQAPEEWNASFRVLMALMRAVTYNVVRKICCVRCCTDYTVPTWLPTLPSGLKVVHQRAGHLADDGEEPCPRPGEWVLPRGMKEDPRTKCPRRVVLYFHGGAFALCKPTTHRGVTMRIIGESMKQRQDMALFTVDYRRPPQHPHPEPLNDCIDAYKWLLGRMRGNNAASRIVFGGDSAGGALVVMVMSELKRQSIPLPAGAIMISPWVDLEDTTSASWHENRNYDYLPADLAKMLANSLVEGTGTTLGDVSATNQDLSSFPPLFVMCGEKEVLRDQVVAFAEKATRAGVEVDCIVEPGMVHAYVAFSDIADSESVDRWYSNIVNFIYKVLGDYNGDHTSVVEPSQLSVKRGGVFGSGRTYGQCCYTLLDDSSKHS